MHENIGPVLTADESVTFCVIEPLHLTLLHYLPLAAFQRAWHWKLFISKDLSNRN
jgi:hypothetical protein